MQRAACLVLVSIPRALPAQTVNQDQYWTSKAGGAMEVAMCLILEHAKFGAGELMTVGDKVC